MHCKHLEPVFKCDTKHEVLLPQLISWSVLCSGFKEQIYDVYRYLPPATQVVLISATLPHEILEMTNKFMTDPIRILVKRSVRTTEKMQSRHN